MQRKKNDKDKNTEDKYIYIKVRKITMILNDDTGG